MFDRVNDLSSSLTGGGGSLDDIDTERATELLHDEETVVQGLANGGSVEHTTDGRSTTVEAAGDYDAYLLVTDRRVLVILGDQPDEIEIAVEMTDVAGVHVRSGLLSNELVVSTDDESVAFDPDEGDLEETADYVERVGGAWSEMDDALSKARRTMASFQSELEDETGDPRDQWLQINSQLSQARHCATREDDAPRESMLARVTETREELERERVSLWLDHAAAAVEAAPDPDDADLADETLSALVDAQDRLDDSRAVVDDVGACPDDAAERLAALTEHVDDSAAAVLAAVEADVETAQGADDPDAAADRWATVAERYRTLQGAGWDGLAGVSADAIEYQLAWVDAKHLDALTSRAAELEAAGDDASDDETARDRYGDAADLFERAHTIATNGSRVAAAGYDEAAERVTEKSERTKWEWGDA
jgi:hypothetical protein